MTISFHEYVRISSGRVIWCAVDATASTSGPVIGRVESLVSVMRNRDAIVTEGEDVLARLASGELARLASVARGAL